MVRGLIGLKAREANVVRGLVTLSMVHRSASAPSSREANVESPSPLGCCCRADCTLSKRKVFVGVTMHDDHVPVKSGQVDSDDETCEKMRSRARKQQGSKPKSPSPTNSESGSKFLIDGGDCKTASTR